MSVATRLVARVAGLPRATTYDVGLERDIRVPMPDGAVLLADRYFPRRAPSAPIVLMRGPYGPRSLHGVYGRLFAERGYQAIVQNVRGTFGSGGTFTPLRQEAADGRATLEWLSRQPWFSGSVGMFGGSYLGYTQWAAAAGAPPYLKALAPHITASQFRRLVHPGGAFALDTMLSWTYLVAHQERPLWRAIPALMRQRRALAPAFAHLPLREADRIAVGRPMPFFDEWIAHDRPEDPYWHGVDENPPLDLAIPVSLLGGWYDLFLPEQLEDYAALRQAGRQPRLVIGPWTHVDLGLQAMSLRETLAWFDTHLRGLPAREGSAPVRVFLMGARRWLDLQDWPPPAVATRWHLQPGRGLARELAPESAPDEYTYDPSHPTPSVGGVVLGPHGGPRDNRALESRRDVLSYTSAVLSDDLDVVGPVAVELHVRSDREHTDFFARLCDVAPGGRSTNVCDGLVRLRPPTTARAADGTTCVRIALWPTAYRFGAGHRLRLQVSSGAHPRFDRNLGAGEPLATATVCYLAHQQVFHDPAHPSALILPVASSLV